MEPFSVAPEDVRVADEGDQLTGPVGPIAMWQVLDACGWFWLALLVLFALFVGVSFLWWLWGWLSRHD